MVLWTGLGTWRAEVGEVDLDGDRLTASGTQLGVDPLPYRLDYSLRTGRRFVTERLEVTVLGRGWRRYLNVRHDGVRRLDLHRRPGRGGRPPPPPPSSPPPAR